MSVSEQLLTYPSPDPKVTLTCYQLTVIGLGEGQVRSCSGTDIDPRNRGWRTLKSFYMSKAIQVAFRVAICLFPEEFP